MRDKFCIFSPSMRDFSYLCKKIADMIADELFANMERLMKHISSDYKRYMYSVLPWNNRLTGLVGPRGVGKTTMVLQYILEHKQEGMHLYVTADSTFFTTHTLVELADECEILDDLEPAVEVLFGLERRISLQRGTVTVTQ